LSEPAKTAPGDGSSSEGPAPTSAEGVTNSGPKSPVELSAGQAAPDPSAEGARGSQSGVETEAPQAHDAGSSSSDVPAPEASSPGVSSGAADPGASASTQRGASDSLVARLAEKPDSAIPERLAYKVVLPDFEGPLDLLLFLCKTHEIDIVKLPVAFITEKYLEYLDVLKQTSVDVAAEYLVMAATLCFLKSRELVPAPEPLETTSEEDESGLDPREELIRRLLEYEKYKDAAEQLQTRPIEGMNVFPRGLPGWEGPRPEGDLAEHSPWKLIEAFAGILEKAGGPQPTHDVVVDRMSVAQRINQLIDRLEMSGGTFRFDSIIDTNLAPAELRHQLVITLLAILELARLKTIRVLEDTASQTFFITQAAHLSEEDLARIREAPITSGAGESKDDSVANSTKHAPASGAFPVPSGLARYFASRHWSQGRGRPARMIRLARISGRRIRGGRLQGLPAGRRRRG